MNNVRNNGRTCWTAWAIRTLRASANQMRPKRYRSTKSPTSYSENGSRARHIFTRHPKLKLHEVHYARHVDATTNPVVNDPEADAISVADLANIECVVRRSGWRDAVFVS